MRLTSFGQPPEDCFISSAISNATQFLSPEHLKRLLHLGIRARLPFDVAVISRVEFEQLRSDRGRYATRCAAAVQNIERPRAFCGWIEPSSLTFVPYRLVRRSRIERLLHCLGMKAPPSHTANSTRFMSVIGLSFQAL